VTWLDACATTAIGVIVGVAELMKRYPARPLSLVRVPGAWLYVTLNGLAAVLALFILHIMDWGFGNDAGVRRISQVFIAGVGAMVLLRASLFTTKVNSQELKVAIYPIIKVFFTAADRSVAGEQAASRVEDSRLVLELSYEQTVKVLPPVCIKLARASEEEADALGKEIGKLDARIRKEHASEEETKFHVALAILDCFGPKVLCAGVDAVKDFAPKPVEEHGQATTSSIGLNESFTETHAGARLTAPIPPDGGALVLTNEEDPELDLSDREIENAPGGVDALNRADGRKSSK
jgi:hypothetical protein